MPELNLMGHEKGILNVVNLNLTRIDDVNSASLYGKTLGKNHLSLLLVCRNEFEKNIVENEKYLILRDIKIGCNRATEERLENFDEITLDVLSQDTFSDSVDWVKIKSWDSFDVNLRKQLKWVSFNSVLPNFRVTAVVFVAVVFLIVCVTLFSHFQ